MNKLKISENPDTEIFVVKAEYQALPNKKKLEILSIVREWIDGQREIIQQLTVNS